MPPKPPGAEDENEHGKAIVERLRAGELPQMVDWFDPGLLAKVGVRSVISATLGQYTDQRLIQASTDIADEWELKTRYDYSGDGPTGEILHADPHGGIWVDYIADLGDGFEATYAMAYLMAADELRVQGADKPLPAGKLLIMGGDQVYPDATKQEYHTRLRDPYDWAFVTDSPARKVFAVPGNHDWYDGLSAFSALFCSSRDRISGGIGTQLGGWRCHQHRSYFAIKLPYGWWIWGPDIQLADNLDDSQRDYFDLMADQTQPGDNIILCLAEPSWHHQNYDNLHEISMLARKKGARICAVIAGDWHHYSRYTNAELGTQFITSGGGGAFAHSTHGLKRTMQLKWASPTGGVRTASATDTAEFNRSERAVIGPGGPDFTQQRVDVPPGSPAAGSGDAGAHGRRTKAVRKEDIKSTFYEMHAPSIYPDQWTSRLLSLKNLLLPFRNRGFTALVGIVYFIFAWVWAASDPRQSPVMQKLATDIAAQATAAESYRTLTGYEVDKLGGQLRALAPGRLAEPDGQAMQRELERATAVHEQAKQSHEAIKARAKAVDGGRQAELEASVARLESTKDMSSNHKFWFMIDIFRKYNSLTHVFNPQAFFAAGEQNPLFAFLLIGLWAGLIFYSESPWQRMAWAGKLLFGTIHFAAHVAALLFISWLVTGFSNPTAALLRYTWPDATWIDITRVVWNFGMTLLLGGILGGFVMGLYWTITCAVFNMHTGDAFGALGLKDYKNFLRIKLEPGRMTIYPIALDKVPDRKGWTWKVAPGHSRPSHNPLLMPIRPMQPRLIEQPIVIEADKVHP